MLCHQRHPRLLRWTLQNLWARFNVFGHRRTLAQFYSVAYSRGIWGRECCLTLQRNGKRDENGRLGGFLCAGTKPEDRWMNTDQLCNYCEMDYEVRRVLGHMSHWRRWREWFVRLFRGRR